MMLDPEMLAATSGRPLPEVRSATVASIGSQRKAIFQKNKFLEFLADRIESGHMTFESLRTFDASLVAANVFAALGVQGLGSDLSTAKATGRINALAPKQLLCFLESAIPAPAAQRAEAAPAGPGAVESSAAQLDAAGG